VELTAAAVSSAARDGARVTLPVPIATFFEDVEAGETAAENADQLTTSITVAPLTTGHAEASAVIQLPHPADALTSSARAISNSADGSTEMAVVAVEDRRAPVLQNLKVCVSASPGDVKEIASRELPTGPALEPATQEANSSHGAVSSEKTIPAASIAATVADYQAKAFGLTEANMSRTGIRAAAGQSEVGLRFPQIVEHACANTDRADDQAVQRIAVACNELDAVLRHPHRC
jgi:hypothetical protein